VNQDLAMNRFVYRDGYLDPYLLPFIKKYHRNDQYVFWTVEFLPKYLSHANSPKTRPIEDFKRQSVC